MNLTKSYFVKNWVQQLVANLHASGFANIFVGYLEGKFLDSCELRPWVYGLHLEEDLNTFLCRLSGFH